MFKLPYTKQQFLVEAGLGNIKTAGKHLKELEIYNFLISDQVGKEILYLNDKLMKALRE